MKIIHRPRNSGRTSKLIALAADDYSYIVCSSHAECARIARQADVMGLSIPFPITYMEFAQGKFCGRGIASFCVDNVDMLLVYLARGVPVKAITI